MNLCLEIKQLGSKRLLTLGLWVMLCLSVANCGGGGGGNSPSNGGDDGHGTVIPDNSNAPFGLKTRPSLAALSFPIQPNLGSLTLGSALYPEYTDKVIAMQPLPGASNRLLRILQTGGVEVINTSTGSTSSIMSLAGVVLTAGEQGLIGLAIDPDFANNHYFYLHYSLSVSGTPTARVSRFTANSNLSSAGSEKVIFQASYQNAGHKAGALAFDSAGNLYIALGDDDVSDHAQDLGSYFGKILRIKVNNGASGPAYTVPSDNPFVSTGGAKPEIWALGFRNPFKMSIDTDGSIWVGDVGEVSYEEVNLVVKGRNYGWPFYEGNHLGPVSSGLPASNFTGPYYEYPHSEGQCIIGGFVYRGSEIPGLVGQYIYGDFVQGTIYALKKNSNGSFTRTLISSEAQYFAGFGLDANNEIYVLSGGARKIIPNGSTSDQAFPAHLSDTGLFTSTAPLTPQSGLIEYQVNSPLWSDNAIKTRWLAVPNDQKITFSPAGNWSFPVGTVLVKHFEMDMTTGDPSSRKHLETRVLVAQVGGSWRGATYRWNNDQTDADLLESGADVTLTIQENGGTRQQAYHYPTASECLACHSQVSGRVLGVRSEQLNKQKAFSDATDNQLRTLNHIGLFNYNIGTPTQYPALSALDSSASLDVRARSYLASNCSFCHQPNGPTPVAMDFRFATAQSSMHAVGVNPSKNLGVSGAKIIAAGAKEQSIVYLRMNSRVTGTQMPPLGSSVIDADAVDVMGQWIDSLQ